MGSLKSRVERLEKEVFKEDTIQTGSVDAKHIKVKKQKPNSGASMVISNLSGTVKVHIIVKGETDRYLYIHEDVNTCARILLAQKKKFNIDGIIWDLPFGIELIMDEYHRLERIEKTKQPEISDEIKAAIKNIEDLQSKFESEINDIINFFTKDWEISYQLKQEINLTTATLTLGTTINVFNAKDSKVVKNAKKMGLLDLWFNKVIR